MDNGGTFIGGDIGLNDKAILTLNDLQEQDFYSLFLHKIEKKKWNRRQKGGVVVYFDIFKFQEVVDILHAEYGLESTDEDIRFGDKFSFALYFDKNLNFLEDMTFFTESAYIRKFKKFPMRKSFGNLRKILKISLLRILMRQQGIRRSLMLRCKRNSCNMRLI